MHTLSLSSQSARLRPAFIVRLALALLLAGTLVPSFPSFKASPSPLAISKPQTLAQTGVRAETAKAETQGRTLAGLYGQIPLGFEANQGQQPEAVKFLARGAGYTLFLTGNAMTLALQQPQSESDNLPALWKAGLDPAQTRPIKPAQLAYVTMNFAGAAPNPEISGLEELPGKTNYFYGNDPANWQTNVANYAKVQYHNIYPGIDLVYYGNEGQLEYDLVVQPGADPKAIRLNFSGVEKVSQNEQGELVLQTPFGPLTQHAPRLYQEVNGVKQLVEGRYRLEGGEGSPATQVQFEIGRYDATQPLVIDPVLIYRTFLGFIDKSSQSDVTVDSQGNAYFTGATYTPNFPTTPGVVQPTFGGSNDAFVIKINSRGTAIVYSTFLGGSDYDWGSSIRVDGNGNAYVAGISASSNFPTTPGAFKTSVTITPSLNGFIAKLNSSATQLIYSTYYGGSDPANLFSLAIDSAGNAYVTGTTYHSPNINDFPLKNSLRQFGISNSYVVVAKLNTTGTDLIWSTILGGDKGNSPVPGLLGATAQIGTRLVLDNQSNVYVLGFNNAFDFPVTTGAFQTSLIGLIDGFVTKLSGDQAPSIAYSSYFGDDGVIPHGIALDSQNNMYIVGETFSKNFPTTLGAFKTSPTGFNPNQGFLSKLNSAGTALVYSTLIGGDGFNYVGAVQVDATGNAYITGGTTADNFPVTSDALQPTRGGGQDAFVTVVNPNGNGLVYSTYLGGSDSELTNGIALDIYGNIYVSGASWKNTGAAVAPPQVSPKPKANAPDPGRAFVAKLGPGSPDEEAAKNVVPADPVAQLRVSPDRSASTDPTNLISYTVTIKNIGAGQGRTLSLKFPLDPALSLGYATFSDPKMWVSAVITNASQPYVLVKLPDMESGQVVSGTIVFRPAAQVKAGTVVFTRYTLYYDDDTGSGKSRLSNGVRFSLSEGGNRDDSGGVVQYFTPASASLAKSDKLTVKADFYLAGEIVSLWYTDKQGQSLSLGNAKTDEQGNVSFEFSASGLNAGESYVVAGYGNRSGVTGSLVVTITS